jgi:transglutaminase-like putative cysteine protease
VNWTLEVRHVTEYRYANPVTFGEHRLMFRPRAGHDIRVLSDELTVSPEADVHWIQDVFSNSVALVKPRWAADRLRVECGFAIDHAGVAGLELPVEPRAARWPFDYTAEERRDLGALLDPHYGDPDGRLYEWMRPFLSGPGRPGTRETLVAMTNAIKAQFRYQPRDEEGTQAPDETLRLGSGTCRDFTLLLMEAARRMGIASRFVSGYLYDPAVDGDLGEVVGAGATHAWMHAYIPGAGWVPFDPTNSLFGGASLIRVAVARDPSQAAPLVGSWFGATGDYLGMQVEVTVRRRRTDQAPG